MAHLDEEQRLGTPTPSYGIMEFQQQRSTNAFFKEMNAFVSTVHTLTPTQRFELTQRALKDMQSVMASHKNAQEKAVQAMELADRRSREVLNHCMYVLCPPVGALVSWCAYASAAVENEFTFME
jgi:hypothetical protein